MKKKLKIGIIAFLIVIIGLTTYKVRGVDDTPANSAFEDFNFYKCVVDEYNSEHSDETKQYADSLSDAELESITTLSCSGYSKADDAKITSSKGIEKLTNITNLDLNSNKLTELDVSKNTELTTLTAYSNQLTTLNLESNIELTSLNLYSNKLTELDVSQNTKLTTIDVHSNQLATLDLTTNSELKSLNAYSNKLTSIELGGCTNLTTLTAYSNQLTTLNLESNIELTNLNLYNNKLTGLDLSKNTKLTTIDVHSNQLATLDLTTNSELKSLNAYSNKLTSIELGSCTNLTALTAYSNLLENIDLKNNIELTSIYLYSDKLSTIDLSKNTKLTTVDIHDNQLSNLNLKDNVALRSLIVNNNNLSNIDLSKNTQLTSLNIATNKLNNLNLQDNTELTNLTINNNNFESIDLSKNTQLTSLNIANNKLKNIDLSNNTKLTALNLSNNNLLSISINANPSQVVDTNTVFSPQTREITIPKKNNKYTLSLKEIDKELDPSKIIITLPNDATFDKELGIITFKTLPETIDYAYKTDWIRNMNVTIVLKDGGTTDTPIEDGESDDDIKKPDDPKNLTDKFEIKNYADEVVNTNPFGTIYDEKNNGRLWTNKNVTISDNGIYHISYNAMAQNFMSNVGTLNYAYDVVFVLDMSGSMSSSDITSMVNAVDNAIKILMEENKNNRIGIVVFESNARKFLSLDHYTTTNSEGHYIINDGSTIKTAEGFSGEEIQYRGGGGTEIQLGFYTGAQLLINSINENDNVMRTPVIILLTDGQSSTIYDYKNLSSERPSDSCKNSYDCVIYTAQYWKNELNKMYGDFYGTRPLVYTIGYNITNLNLTTMLNPNAENMEQCKENSSCKSYIYDILTSDDAPFKDNYQYSEGSFNGEVSEEELKDIFKNIVDKILYASKSPIEDDTENVDDNLKASTGYLIFEEKINENFSISGDIVINIKDKDYIFTKVEEGFTSKSIKNDDITINYVDNKLIIKIKSNLVPGLNPDNWDPNIKPLSVDYNVIYNEGIKSGIYYLSDESKSTFIPSKYNSYYASNYINVVDKNNNISEFANYVDKEEYKNNFLTNYFGNNVKVVVNQHMDEPLPVSPQTGGYLVGSLVLVGLVIGLYYKYYLARKNKINKI